MLPVQRPADHLHDSDNREGEGRRRPWGRVMVATLRIEGREGRKWAGARQGEGRRGQALFVAYCAA